MEQRKIQAAGTRVYINLPAAMLEELGIDKGDNVLCLVRKGRLEIYPEGTLVEKAGLMDE